MVPWLPLYGLVFCRFSDNSRSGLVHILTVAGVCDELCLYVLSCFQEIAVYGFELLVAELANAEDSRRFVSHDSELSFRSIRANWKHGRYSAQAKHEARLLHQLVSECREQCREMALLCQSRARKSND